MVLTQHVPNTQSPGSTHVRSIRTRLHKRMSDVSDSTLGIGLNGGSVKRFMFTLLTEYSHYSVISIAICLQLRTVLLSSQFWPIQSMSRGVINSVKQRLSHPFSRIKSIDQWAVDPYSFLTLTTSAKIGRTAILRFLWLDLRSAAIRSFQYYWEEREVRKRAFTVHLDEIKSNFTCFRRT